VDIVVKPNGPEGWSLVDLLGRDMGLVKEVAPGEFRIIPGARVAETMQAMKHGPYGGLDAALSAIETHLRATCRLAAEAPPTDHADKGERDDDA
jgi:hypothetical protein